MIVQLDKDEWYPVYSVIETDRPGLVEAAVDGRTMRRWKRAFMEFEKVQDEMEKVFDANCT